MHTGVSMPITLGHEMSGTVSQIGSEVTNLKVGQRVAVNPAMDERHYGMDPCNNCQSGKFNICKRFASYGLSAPGGGFSDQIVVKSLNCIVLPDSVDLKVGALAEPLAVAWHCIRTSGFQTGQTALILGAGPIGLAILLLLKVWGAKKIIISEPTATRAELARKFGADVVVNPLKKLDHEREDGILDPVVAAAHDLTNDGIDVAFDATGLQSTLDAAIASVRPGGTIFNVAIHEKPLLLNLNSLAVMEKTLTGGICYTNEDFEAVINVLASGEIDAEQMITSVVPLADIIQGGFMELINNKAYHVKILIQPTAET
jgi:(R,R)-butanediol dehydrogenase/meso-butanediol dehydrogenase/diacetyl reductase